jgi:hypothetical protein
MTKYEDDMSFLPRLSLYTFPCPHKLFHFNIPPWSSVSVRLNPLLLDFQICYNLLRVRILPTIQTLLCYPIGNTKSLYEFLGTLIISATPCLDTVTLRPTPSNIVTQSRAVKLVLCTNPRIWIREKILFTDPEHCLRPLFPPPPFPRSLRIRRIIVYG